MDGSAKVTIISQLPFTAIKEIYTIHLIKHMYRQWMYLEPIFSSEDINRQLPVETRKFNTMQRNWKQIMKNAYGCPYVCKANLTSCFVYISPLNSRSTRTIEITKQY